MKKLFCTLMLAVASILTLPSNAQTFTVPPSTCGPANTLPLYCHNINLSLDGGQTSTSSVWLDLKILQKNVLVTTTPEINYQFMLFSGDLAEVGTTHVDSYYATTGTVVSGTRTATEVVKLTVTFSGNGYEGTANFDFGYYYSTGSGRGGGGAGWKFSATDGKLLVSASAPASHAAASPVAPTPTSCPECGKSASTVKPEYGGYILECGWTGVLPPYRPTGHVGANGIEVEAQCFYFNTLTGTWGAPTNMSWWIPWAIWFFPPAQTPYCESANYSTSTCSQYLNVNAIKASTPAHPNL